jgi:hypothetical protein
MCRKPQGRWEYYGALGYTIRSLRGGFGAKFSMSRNKNMRTCSDCDTELGIVMFALVEIERWQMGLSPQEKAK